MNYRKVFSFPQKAFLQFIKLFTRAGSKHGFCGAWRVREGKNGAENGAENGLFGFSESGLDKTQFHDRHDGVCADSSVGARSLHLFPPQIEWWEESIQFAIRRERGGEKTRTELISSTFAVI